MSLEIQKSSVEVFRINTKNTRRVGCGGGGHEEAGQVRGGIGEAGRVIL